MAISTEISRTAGDDTIFDQSRIPVHVAHLNLRTTYSSKPSDLINCLHFPVASDKTQSRRTLDFKTTSKAQFMLKATSIMVGPSEATETTSRHFKKRKITQEPGPEASKRQKTTTLNDTDFILPTPSEVTAFQERVYTHLLCIPAGAVTSYAILARQLSSSPRAVGGALRKNPYAPKVPCHRVMAANGFVGGFMGDWQKAPSGINQSKKLDLLKAEGVDFTPEGKLIEKEHVWFKGPWKR
ncbi:hypothetical protein E4T42_08396 [Aureobasidium subglaciale]|nr:hypothetical protein E4T42_08396 [Aureobasidium subglaciale]